MEQSLSIFGHCFLTVIVDEVHHMRNPGNKHVAILHVLQQATVRIIMTATPPHTAAIVPPLLHSSCHKLHSAISPPILRQFPRS